MATTAAASGARDGRGRFVPGMSGNPAGKKPGTLNKATLWRQAMEDGDELAGRRRMVAQMREGDQRATMYILKQIDGPDRKVAAIALPIPPGSDVATVFGSIKAKMILGEVSPDEALAWFTALDKGVKVVTAQLMDGHVDRRMDEASAEAAEAEAAERSAPDEPASAAGDGTQRGRHERAVGGGPAPVERAPDPGPSVPPAPAVQADAGSVAGDRQAAAQPPSQPSPAGGQAGSAGQAATAAAAPEAPLGPVAKPAPAPPPAPVPPVSQPCISPAFPGRRRSIVAARTAAEEAARRAAVPPPVQPQGDRRPGGVGGG